LVGDLPSMKRRRIELIHAHESAPGLVVGLAAIGTGIPVVLSFHGSNPERIREFGRIGRMVATRLITPSYRSAEDLATTGGVPRERLHVIGLGIKPVATPAPEAVAEIRGELLGPDGRILVLTVARLYPRKRVEDLLEAAVLLKERIGDVQIRIIGEGPEGPRLHALHQRLALGDTVVFLGHVTRDTLALEYSRAHCFCLPTVQEGFGLVFAEAMAAGLPVVACRAAAVPEIVRDGETGLLVAPRTPAALAAALERMLTDDGLRKEMGMAGRTQVETLDLVPVARMMGAALDPQRGAVDAQLNLIKRAHDLDTNKAFLTIARNLYQPGTDGVYPASNLADVLSELNRSAPGQGGPLAGTDYQSILGEVKGFLIDDQRGFTRFLNIVKARGPH